MNSQAIYATRELLGLEEYVNHKDKKYVLFCDYHGTFMFGQTKKELKGLDSKEYCIPCREA